MNVYHIIDHEGFGTIHNLLIPLCKKYQNHKLFIPYIGNNYLSYDVINKINNDLSAIIIIHSTGRINSNIMQNFNNIFSNKKILIFLHTSYNYQCYKLRESNINFYKFIEETYNVVFLVPSLEVKEQYLAVGIKNIKVVQLGIMDIENKRSYKEYRNDLAEYYNKIITTCSSSNKDYFYIKGIDLYTDFITKNDLFKESLIAGIDCIENKRILTKKFNMDDFLNVLYHSKMYIQFSRYESYNITAVQAKRFKKGVFLLNSEGNNSCMKGLVYNNRKELENDILKYLNNSEMFLKRIDLLYIDSLKRESLENFKNSIERLGEN